MTLDQLKDGKAIAGVLGGPLCASTLEYLLTDNVRWWIPIVGALLGILLTQLAWTPLKRLLQTARRRFRSDSLSLQAAINVAGDLKRQIDELNRELTALHTAHRNLQQLHGKAILQVAGWETKSRNLSVAVQYVDVDDAVLANRICDVVAGNLQNPSSRNRCRAAEHILMPSVKPSVAARIIVFSDVEYYRDAVVAALNKYRLIDELEPVEGLDRQYAQYHLPEVDLAIIVYPFQKGE